MECSKDFVDIGVDAELRAVECDHCRCGSEGLADGGCLEQCVPRDRCLALLIAQAEAPSPFDPIVPHHGDWRPESHTVPCVAEAKRPAPPTAALVRHLPRCRRRATG